MDMTVQEMNLEISGMTCSHCVARVTSALKSVAGVEVKSVATGSATLAYDPSRATPAQIVQAVAEAGYAANLRA